MHSLRFAIGLRSQSLRLLDDLLWICCFMLRYFDFNQFNERIPEEIGKACEISWFGSRTFAAKQKSFFMRLRAIRTPLGASGS